MRSRATAGWLLQASDWEGTLRNQGALTLAGLIVGTLGVLVAMLAWLWPKSSAPHDESTGPGAVPSSVVSTVTAGNSTTTSAGTPTSTEPATVPPPPEVNERYLSDFGEGPDAVREVGTSTIGGRSFPDSVTLTCYYSGDRISYASYQLGGDYKTLRLYVGIDDEVQASEYVGTVRIESVYGPAPKPLRSIKATKDKATLASVDVTGVRTLRISCTPDNRDYQGLFSVELGNALLRK